MKQERANFFLLINGLLATVYGIAMLTLAQGMLKLDMQWGQNFKTFITMQEISSENCYILAAVLMRLLGIMTAIYGFVLVYFSQVITNKKGLDFIVAVIIGLLGWGTMFGFHLSILNPLTLFIDGLGGISFIMAVVLFYIEPANEISGKKKKENSRPLFPFPKKEKESPKTKNPYLEEQTAGFDVSDDENDPRPDSIF